MIKLTWDQGFKKIYKKKIKNNEELKKTFWDAIELFSKEPFNPRLRTHKLTGRLEGLWAFSVAFDCRIIFNLFNRVKTLLKNIND